MPKETRPELATNTQVASALELEMVKGVPKETKPELASKA
jgi:hypothetical protein